MDGERYDVIVIGAGSAGCVLGARLSEDPGVRVLVLEAGGTDLVDQVKIPIAFGSQFRTKLDWNYTTEEQKHLQGRRIYWPRAKMLGGCSSMNAMIYIRGSRHDFDEWSDLGNEGWSYDEVLPYFLRSEDNAHGASTFHAAGGPLRVEDQRSPNPWSTAFVESAVAAGNPRNADFNGATQDGAGAFQVTQRSGARWNTAEAFLRPAMGRPNLTVTTHALTTKILFEGKRAVGVQYREGGSLRTAYADREIVLSGGAVNSPQLLMLSGVGPAAHLRDLGIDVVHDLPGVGEGLQDHPTVPLVFRPAKDAGSLMAAQSLKQFGQYMLRKRGMLTSPVAESGLYFRSRPELEHIDMQWFFAPIFFFDQAATDVPFHAMTIANTVVRVASRGRVRLRSADPTWKPEIDAGYLSDDEDLEALVAGIRHAREVMRTGPLAAHVGKEWYPGADVGSPDALRDAVRAKVETLYHPVSSCRMGVDEMAVVDPQLRVHGIEGLRVADASVMPTLVRGNTNAPTIMIGEKAADLIRGLAAPRPLVGARA